MRRLAFSLQRLHRWLSWHRSPPLWEEEDRISEDELAWIMAAAVLCTP